MILFPPPPPHSPSLSFVLDVKLIDSVSVCECSAVQREKQQNWTEENSSSLFSFLLFFLLLEGEGEEAEPSKETIHRRSVWVWSALPLSFRVEDSPRQPQRRVYFFFFSKIPLEQQNKRSITLYVLFFAYHHLVANRLYHPHIRLRLKFYILYLLLPFKKKTRVFSASCVLCRVYLRTVPWACAEVSRHVPII